MDIKNAKRIAIVGIPGSGKSTLGLHISKSLNLPLIHLDRVVFNEDGSKKDLGQYLNDHKEIIGQDSWVIEGCSIKTFKERAERADLIIIIECSRYKAFYRLLKRAISFQNKLKQSGTIRFPNWILIKYIWNFPHKQGKIIKEVSSSHASVFKVKQTKDLL